MTTQQTIHGLREDRRGLRDAIAYCLWGVARLQIQYNVAPRLAESVRRHTGDGITTSVTAAVAGGIRIAASHNAQDFPAD